MMVTSVVLLIAKEQTYRHKILVLKAHKLSLVPAAEIGQTKHEGLFCSAESFG